MVTVRHSHLVASSAPWWCEDLAVQPCPWDLLASMTFANVSVRPCGMRIGSESVRPCQDPCMLLLSHSQSDSGYHNACLMGLLRTLANGFSFVAVHLLPTTFSYFLHFKTLLIMLGQQASP